MSEKLIIVTLDLRSKPVRTVGELVQWFALFGAVDRILLTAEQAKHLPILDGDRVVDVALEQKLSPGELDAMSRIEVC